MPLKASPQSDAEVRMSAAALAVFAKYGVRKATMAEIAAEAGVSKPTLYAVFSSKDHALGGAILLAKGEAIARAQQECAEISSLPDKIEHFFQRVAIDLYDLVANAPDAEALEEALGEASEQAIELVEQWTAEALADMLAPFNTSLQSRGLEAQDLANFAISSANNLKRHATDRSQLVDYLAILRALIVAAAQSTTEPPRQ